MVLLIIVIPYYFIIKNIEVFIMNLKYKKATIEDLDILTKTKKYCVPLISYLMI